MRILLYVFLAFGFISLSKYYNSILNKVYGPVYEWWEYINAAIDMYHYSPIGPISCWGDLNSKLGCKCYTYNNSFEWENFISTNASKPIYVQIDEFKSKNKKFILESTIRKKCSR